MPDPLDGYDWDWSARFGKDVEEELGGVFRLFALFEYPDMAPNRLQVVSSEYAALRGGELLTLDGDVNLMALTRRRVAGVVSKAMEEGVGIQELRKRLEADQSFSRERALRVARTETTIAQGQGSKAAAREQGRNEKRWISQGDSLVTAECLENEAEGWIGLDDAFASGQDVVPQHPNCRCSNLYRTAAFQGESSFTLDFRCLGCGALLHEKAMKGTDYYCRRCKVQRRA